MLCALALAATLTSVHVPRRDFNQTNPGVGVECDAPDWALAAGEYRNSYDRTTAYALAAWLPVHAHNWSFGAFAGPATGYPLPVMGGLMARYAPPSGAGVNLVLAPPAEKQGSTMLGIQLTWRFGR